MNLSWVQIGSVMMFLGVTLGAFGAHILRDKLTPHYMDVLKTGIFYHFVHALALFVVAWLTTQSSDVKVHYAGLFFLLGIVLFSGSLYLLSITEIKWIGIITPLGGLSFLAGWILLFLSRYHNFF